MTTSQDELGLGELVERMREPVDWAHFVTDDHAADYQAERHEAADALTSLIAERDGLREALSGLLRGEYESAEPGLCDCVDNHGKPYQSQFLADRIAAAEAALYTWMPLMASPPPWYRG